VIGDTDRAMLRISSDGELRLIACEGDQLDVSDSPDLPDYRVIETLRYAQDGFNHVGKIAFAASFTDGSEGNG
jgi:hypothetical protein